MFSKHSIGAWTLRSTQRAPSGSHLHMENPHVLIRLLEIGILMAIDPNLDSLGTVVVPVEPSPFSTL